MVCDMSAPTLRYAALAPSHREYVRLIAARDAGLVAVVSEFALPPVVACQKVRSVRRARAIRCDACAVVFQWTVRSTTTTAPTRCRACIHAKRYALPSLITLLCQDEACAQPFPCESQKKGKKPTRCPACRRAHRRACLAEYARSWYARTKHTRVASS